MAEFALPLARALLCTLLTGACTLPPAPPPPLALRSYEADLLKWFDRLLIDLRKRIDANTVRLATDDNAPLPTEDVQRLDNMAQQMNDMLARAAVSTRPSLRARPPPAPHPTPPPPYHHHHHHHHPHTHTHTHACCAC